MPCQQDAGVPVWRNKGLNEGIDPWAEMSVLFVLTSSKHDFELLT